MHSTVLAGVIAIVHALHWAMMYEVHGIFVQYCQTISASYHKKCISKKIGGTRPIMLCMHASFHKEYMFFLELWSRTLAHEQWREELCSMRCTESTALLRYVYIYQKIIASYVHAWNMSTKKIRTQISSILTNECMQKYADWMHENYQLIGWIQCMQY